MDNALTPHLLVKAEEEGVRVPAEFVQDGRIVLCVAPDAVRGLDLGNDFVAFGARFAGRHFDVSVPVGCVLAVYAQENGRGIALAEEEEAPPPQAPPPEDAPPKGGGGRPRLRVVG